MRELKEYFFGEDELHESDIVWLYVIGFTVFLSVLVGLTSFL